MINPTLTYLTIKDGQVISFSTNTYATISLAEEEWKRVAMSFVADKIEVTLKNGEDGHYILQAGNYVVLFHY